MRTLELPNCTLSLDLIVYHDFTVAFTPFVEWRGKKFKNKAGILENRHVLYWGKHAVTYWMTNYSTVNRFAIESWSQWQNLSNSSGCKYPECIGLLWGREWSCWASSEFQLHLVSCRKALAWACGCQAPPEVTLSEPVKPEINHSHPSKAALHRHCD